MEGLEALISQRKLDCRFGAHPFRYQFTNPFFRPHLLSSSLWNSLRRGSTKLCSGRHACVCVIHGARGAPHVTSYLHIIATTRSFLPEPFDEDHRERPHNYLSSLTHALPLESNKSLVVSIASVLTTGNKFYFERSALPSSHLLPCIFLLCGKSQAMADIKEMLKLKTSLTEY